MCCSWSTMLMNHSSVAEHLHPSALWVYHSHEGWCACLCLTDICDVIGRCWSLLEFSWDLYLTLVYRSCPTRLTNLTPVPVNDFLVQCGSFHLGAAVCSFAQRHIVVEPSSKMQHRTSSSTSAHLGCVAKVGVPVCVLPWISDVAFS